MQRLCLIIVMMSIFGLTSCTESKVPIDAKPMYKVDKKYIGTWEEQKDHQTFVVSMIDDYHYKIIMSSKKDGSKTYFKAYTSMVNSFNFGNISEIKKGQDKRYVLCRIMDMPLNNRQIAIAFVEDTTISTFSNSEELKSYIKAHLNNPTFYSDTGILVRVK